MNFLQDIFARLEAAGETDRCFRSFVKGRLSLSAVTTC